MNKDTLSQDEQIELFLSLFGGLKNVFGTYNARTGKVHQIKAIVDNNVIVGHLWGSHPYGVYLLVKDKTRAIAIDFDTQEMTPVIKFITKTKQLHIPAYIERSKSKGHHIWIFFDHPVPAAKARLVVHHILNRIGLGATEVFPKRDRLDEKVSYGNFINAPLFCLSVKEGRTIFIDPGNCYKPYKDQWQLLYSIEKLSEAKLDAIINSCSLTITSGISFRKPKKIGISQYKSLLPCAHKMLNCGVTQYQRLACFRLAINLKRTGLPFDAAVSVLNTWSLKNRPQQGKRIITEKEIISQTRSAYLGGYRSVGCQCPSVIPYCDPDCPIRKKRT